MPVHDIGYGHRIRVHSRFVRVTHWINALAIIIMIGSGWRIYNNVPIFSWLTFPEWATLGGDPEITYKLNKDVGFSNALLWHFAAMWVFFLNGIVALGFGLLSGRLQMKWLPVRVCRTHPRHPRGPQFQSRSRRHHGLQCGPETPLYWRDPRRDFDARLRACHLEAGSVPDANLAFLRFSGRQARPFHWNERDRLVPYRPRHPRYPRAENHHRHDKGEHSRRQPRADGARPGRRIAMTTIRPRRSINRPQGGVDQSALIEHRRLIAGIERRAFLRGSVSLGALTLLTGCDISNNGALQGVLRAMSGWNDRVQAFLFNPHKLAPTYTDADVMMPPRFNAFYGIDDVKPVDGATWKLELAGLIENKQPWTKDALYALPQETQITRHVCVEGWDYIGKWSGVPLRAFSRPHRRGQDGEICRLQMRGQILGQHRHGDSAASADHPCHPLRGAAHRRCLRLSDAAQDATQARLQAAEMDLRHGGDEHLSRRLLGRWRL